MRIAIVGSGISGLTAAYYLSKKHEVLLFEKDTRLGGHTNTVTTNHYGIEHAVDTGFIVFNKKTYPNFCHLLNILQVDIQKSDMSFSFSDSEITYNGTNLRGLFCDKSNIINPVFLKMLKNIISFNLKAKRNLRCQESLQSFLLNHSYDKFFINKYLLPLCSAIWSSDTKNILQYPCCFLFQFMDNHGLLNIIDRPTWYTIKGGSKNYIEKIMKSSEIDLHLCEPVEKVKTYPTLSLQTHKGKYKVDKIILACHSNQASELLPFSHPAKESLTKISYTHNNVLLHTDISILPLNQKAWAAWNFSVRPHNNLITYYLNYLHKIDRSQPLLVSLNAEEFIDPAKVLYKTSYEHPLYDNGTLTQQKKLRKKNGVDCVYFAGAYMGHGFHEDGVNSALTILQDLDCLPPNHMFQFRQGTNRTKQGV